MINDLMRAYRMGVSMQNQSKHRNQRKGMKAKQVAQRRAQERNRRKVNRGRR